MRYFAAMMLILVSLTACSQNESVNQIIQGDKDAVVAVFMSHKTDQTKNGLGTGFFIGENEILTNYHVAGSPDHTIKVAVKNSNKTYDATVVAGDKNTDIALLKLNDWNTFIKDNPKIKYLKFATKPAEETQTVWTIGHPGGLFYSISRGVVSVDAKKSPDPFPMWWIQTDAHVFQGNSGGPMLNDEGEVLGMNSDMIVQEGGSYGFAIPTPLIKKVLSDLKQYNEVRWATLGIVLEGNTIAKVVSGGAADKAGIKEKDVVRAVGINGIYTEVDGAMKLIKMLSKIDYNTPIVLELTRGDDEPVIKLTPDYKTSQLYLK